MERSSLEDLDEYMGEMLKGKSKHGLAEVGVTRRDIALEKRRRHGEEVNCNFVRGRVGEALRVKGRGTPKGVMRVSLEGLLLGEENRKSRIRKQTKMNSTTLPKLLKLLSSL